MERELTDWIVKIPTWVALISASGFVGYFGTYASTPLRGRLHTRKTGPQLSQPARERSRSKEDYILEKKRHKALEKQAKNQGKTCADLRHRLLLFPGLSPAFRRRDPGGTFT